MHAGKAIKGLPRENLIIATKFGIVKTEDGTALDGSSKHCRQTQLFGVLSTVFAQHSLFPLYSLEKPFL
jgi:hypothetical protein